MIQEEGGRGNVANICVNVAVQKVTQSHSQAGNDRNQMKGPELM